jgi:hypothetical protein
VQRLVSLCKASVLEMIVLVDLQLDQCKHNDESLYLFIIHFILIAFSSLLHSISANTGIRAGDIGMSQLSMHSIREIMGVKDLIYGYNYLLAFFGYPINQAS